MEADEKAIWIARRLLGFILSGNCCHLGLYVNNGEAGITLPIEMSFVPPEEVLQIVLAAVLRNQKRCGNRGVPIVLHEFADKLRADGIGIEELPDHFRLIRCHIPSLLLKA